MRLLLCVPFLSLALFAQQTTPQPSETNFQISGIVVNAIRGEALPHTKVTIAASFGRNQVYTMTTGGDGKFLFANLAPGKYSLGAQRQGFYDQGFQQHEAYTTAIAVGPGKQSDNIVFPVKPESAIYGRIVDEQSEPLRNAQVILYERTAEEGVLKTQNRHQSRSDDLGAFRFSHLRPGTYFIAVIARPWYAMAQNSYSVASEGATLLDVAYPVTYFQGTQDPDSALPIVLHAGDSATADISLVPVAALHLQVSRRRVDPSRPTMPSLVPRVFGRSQDLSGSTQMSSTSSNGGTIVEEIVGVAPGQYDVQTHTVSAGNALQTSNRTVTLSKDGILDVEDYTPVVHVSGIVNFAGATGPQEASIQFREANSGVLNSNTLSANNDFQNIPLKPGSYQILMATRGGYFIQGITAVGAKVTGRSIEIPSSGPVQLTITASRGVAQISGVAQRNDDPASGVMIVLVPQDPASNTPLFRRDQSDSDGTFTLADVLPGNYTALAIENRWDLEWANPYALAPYMAKGEAVKVEAGAKLNLRLNVQ
ncbi:MAG: hypothetical protein JWO13_1166 [Acidobacteriales bacterium]|nr:hypothetical protein [Terriglobales bacterium]